MYSAVSEAQLADEALTVQPEAWVRAKAPVASEPARCRGMGLCNTLSGAWCGHIEEGASGAVNVAAGGVVSPTASLASDTPSPRLPSLLLLV